ncbi:MAG: HNH endonuclease, partial [Candidatus Nanopelagicaceae bacterium]
MAYALLRSSLQWLSLQSGEAFNKEGLALSREYDKTHYRKLREKILSINNACYYCGQEANTIDHLIPISKGGISSEDNCVPCCHRCNSGKRDRIAPGSFLRRSSS